MLSGMSSPTGNMPLSSLKADGNLLSPKGIAAVRDIRANPLMSFLSAAYQAPKSTAGRSPEKALNSWAQKSHASAKAHGDLEEPAQEMLTETTR